jgi:HSP20 family molecular chaperone IbpA
MSHCNRGFEFGGSLDDIIGAAREFGEKMKEKGLEIGDFWANDYCGPWAYRHHDDRFNFDPPVNSYSTRDGSLVFEFALAGIDESGVKVEFQGDYLVLSAKASARRPMPGKADSTVADSGRGTSTAKSTAFPPTNTSRTRPRRRSRTASSP